jgi:hypothetical protein
VEVPSASAILQSDGNLEQVTVRQGPEHQLADPLIEALQHWLFEPGKIDGEPGHLKFCWAFVWQLLIKASTKTCKICCQRAANKSNK